jgi:hypothetical protein
MGFGFHTRPHLKLGGAGIALFLTLSGSVVLAASNAPAHPASAHPASAPNPSGLEQKKIHADYNDGNFEKVISALEAFMATHKTYSFDDSIFIAKHLAVVYTANPETREKGKYYMYRLLSLLPSAKLVDMYVSDEIDRIFDKIRDEFMARQKSFGVDTAKVSVPTQSPARDARETAAAPPSASASGRPAASGEKAGGGSHRTVYLVAGGTVLVALGVAAYFVLSEPPKSTDKTFVVP